MTGGPSGLVLGLVLGHVFEPVLESGSLTATVLVAETDPGLRDGLTEHDVSPGLLGFAVMFAAVVVCIPLLRSMVGKIRGVDHRVAADGSGAPDAPEATVEASGGDQPAE